MINFDKGMLAYTTRDVRNYGMFKANSLYKYLFTREDNMLLNTGAIKLLPYSMFKIYTSHDCMLNSKKYKSGDIINTKDFTDSVIRTLIKTNVIKCELIEELNNLKEDEIVKLAKIYECAGLTFNQVSNIFNIDFEILKEKFDLKQGGKQKKVTNEDIQKIKEILLGE